MLTDFIQRGGVGGQKIARVAVLMGQSNMAGTLGEEGALPSGWRGRQYQILIANYGPTPATYGPFEFKPLHPGSNAGTIWDGTVTGMEEAIMHDLYDMFEETVFLLKLSFGGYNIEHWLPGGDYYTAMHTLIPDAEARLLAMGYDEIQYLPMVFAGGESNTTDSTAVYQAKLESFIDDYRSLSSGTAAQHVYFQLLSNLQTAYTSTQRGNVNAAFANVSISRPHVHTVNVEPLNPSVIGDNIHYNLAGHTTIGHNYVARWITDGIL